jgi:hypothetical protein
VRFLEIVMSYLLKPLFTRPARRHGMRLGALCSIASAAALTGCIAYPVAGVDYPATAPAYPVAGPAPSPILSRLPPQHPGAASTSAHPLSPAEKRRYDAIDKQVLRDQDQAIADQAAAAAWARSYTPPVTVYGGYGYGYGGYGYGYPYGYGGGAYYGW